jgi:hypothetical protein
MSANEVHLSVTQGMLRHKKMSTTAEIYTHKANKPQLDAQVLFLSAIGRNKARAGANAGAEAQKQRA